MADSSENHATVVLLEAEAEAGGGPSAADGRRLDDAAAVVKPTHQFAGVGRFLRAVRVVCDCALIVFLFLMSSILGVREGPWRRLQLALVGVAYAAVAALVWFGRGPIPAGYGSARWKKPAAMLAATVVGGVLTYCTNCALCGLSLFPWILHDIKLLSK